MEKGGQDGEVERGGKRRDATDNGFPTYGNSILQVVWMFGGHKVCLEDVIHPREILVNLRKEGSYDTEPNLR